MGWLSRLFGGPSSSRNASDDIWFNPVGGSSAAGVRVTHDRAYRVSVVLACVRVISESAGALPLKVYARESNGDKTPLDDHPLCELLHDKANDEHTAMEFREAMTSYCVSRGWAAAEIIPGARNAIGQLIPIHPDFLRPIKGEGRSWFIEINEPDAPTRVVPREEFFIIRSMATVPGCPIIGLDPIAVERETIGAALAVQDYASRFFANDAQAGGIIKHPTKFATEADKEKFVAAWQRAGLGTKRHRARVLEHSMEFTPTTVTNEQAQFLETRRYLDVDIARIFRVPAHKVGILDRATFSNIEQQSIEFVTDTMLPWLVRWEQAIKRDLILRQGLFAEHNVLGLLRGDTLSRYQAYAIARNWGWLSANDIRRAENMNGLGEDGDQYLKPLNMEPAGAPGEPSGMGRDQRQAFNVNGKGHEIPSHH